MVRNVIEMAKPAMLALKRFVGPLLANDATGRWIARLFGDRIPHRGLRFDTSHPIIRNEIKAALFFRGYESAEYRFVSKHIPRDCDVVELGGSMGVISCAIRKMLDRDRKLVVVEADPRLADVLRRNLALNGCEANVTICQQAIAYPGGGTIAFIEGETSVSGRIAEAGTALRTIDVPAVTLSTLLDRNGIADFCLVSDIEGVEWDIFAHDIDALSRARVIVLEMHAASGVESECAQIDTILATGLFDIIDSYGAVVALARKDVPTR